MKTTPRIPATNQRHDFDPRASRGARIFPPTDQNYQSSTLSGSCGKPAKFHGETSFFQLSNEYFADEAPRSFLVETGVFTALILTTLLPIVNSAQAVAVLIHHVGVL